MVILLSSYSIGEATESKNKYSQPDNSRGMADMIIIVVGGEL